MRLKEGWIVLLLLVAYILVSLLRNWRNPAIVLPPLASKTTRNQPIVEFGWWSPFVQETARVFQKSNSSKESPSWCHLMDATEFHKYPPNEDQPPRGLLYVKSHKASSSTCEGINFVIAHHVGRRKQLQLLADNHHAALDTATPTQPLQKCEHYNRHVFANEKLHGNVPPRSDRVGTRSSLLWTFVRHPTARDISQVYHFEVSGRGKDPFTQTTELLEILEDQKSRQTKYLCPTDDCAHFFREASWANVTSYEKPFATNIQEQIFQHFDFIGVTERMTESLAVMTLLWDLDPIDVIVLSSKRAGSGKNATSYDGGGVFRGKLHRCAKLIQPSPLPVPLESYVHSSAHREGNADFLLYYAAIESLDRTIDSLGRDVVEERVATLTFLQNLVSKACLDSAIFPCSSEGVWQEERSQHNCFIQDAGCGYPCVDETLKQYAQYV